MSDFDFDEMEAAQVAQDAADLIEADKTSATLYRPIRAGQGEFYGSFETDATNEGTIPVDLHLQPNPDALERDCNAIADVKRGTDIRWHDVLVIDGKKYRVRYVQPMGVGGVETHIRCQLFRDYQESP